MYFDFEDYHPSIEPVGRALTPLEMVLLTIIFHLVMVILVLVSPKWLPRFLTPVPAAIVQAPPRDHTQFVFVQPRLDMKAPRPPVRGEASDMDRMARARERAPNPKNDMPFARGNTPERVERMEQPRPKGQGPAPDPAAGRQSQAQPAPSQQQAETQQQKLPDSVSGLQLPNPNRPAAAPSGAAGAATTPGGQLGDALRNLQRYVQRDSFDNPQGGGGEFGPEIQFDTKGVEFGPWIRRFIAQVKRNWFVPYAAMTMKGHVVITFNVHKDGSITDLAVVGPCPVEAFNNAAFGALASSNPTQPLPPEYPSEKAFFTVTFYYNETPR
jgi:TonB family protein